MSDPCHVLLIEDNPADVYLVQTALAEAGLTAVLFVCTDGEEALRRIGEIESGQARCPDVLLLDLNLPKYTGEELLEHLRQSAIGCWPAVIVITSSDSPQDRERARALGAEHYFRKPYGLDEFMRLGELVRSTLESRHVQPYRRVE